MYIIFALHLTSISSLLGAINFIVTFINMRTIGLHMINAPLFVWAIFFTAILLLLSLPVLTAGVTLLLMDRNFNTGFYEVAAGGDPVLYQHLFFESKKQNLYIYIYEWSALWAGYPLPTAAELFTFNYSSGLVWNLYYLSFFIFIICLLILKLSTYQKKGNAARRVGIRGLCPLINLSLVSDKTTKLKIKPSVSFQSAFNLIQKRGLKTSTNIKPETDFYRYHELRKLLNLPYVSNDYLYWLIGFAEGDGSFVINNRNDLSFIITQNTKYKSILEDIKTNLGFGKVIKQGPNTSRYVIQNNLENYLIALIFNNNVILPSKLDSFNIWLNMLNTKINNDKFSRKLNKKRDLLILNEIVSININEFPKELLLNNSWFSGFVDAEGSFCCYIKNGSTSTKLKFSILFDIAQKYYLNKVVLDKLILLFETGNVYKHYSPDAFNYRVSGVKNCLKLFEYFNKYPLKSNKLNVYLMWVKILIWLNDKNHLNLKKNELFMIDVIKNLNK